jgi:hypothetical protein
MLLAAGAVWFESWLGRRAEKTRRLGRGLLWGTQVIGSLIAIVLIKPIAPINSPLWEITSGVNEEVTEMIGWQELTGQVSEIFQSIPEAEKPHTVILAGNYGEAGAFVLYGDEYALPRVISGTNSLWYRGFGEPEPETVIVVGFESSYASSFSSPANSAAQYQMVWCMERETTHHTSLFVCREPRQPWKGNVAEDAVVSVRNSTAR